MKFEEFGFWLLCALLAGGVGLLVHFLNGILKEMKSMNDKLIKVVSNQEWHYTAIKDLQERVRDLEHPKNETNLGGRN